MSQIDETAAKLSAHEQVCSERYKGIELRMNAIEHRVDGISSDVKDIKQTNDKQFGEIKDLLTNAKDEKFKIVVTATSTVIVGLLAMLGYLITHLSK